MDKRSIHEVTESSILNNHGDKSQVQSLATSGQTNLNNQAEQLPEPAKPNNESTDACLNSNSVEEEIISSDHHSTAKAVNKSIIMKMQDCFNYARSRIKLLSIIVIISITVLATLKHDQLMVRKTPSPTKFFSSESLIEDYETGSFSQLIDRALESDVSFVMYYAPWDAECINFKREFELIANHYPNQIFFAAINCWWPDGECRKRNMVVHYPSFSAHLRNGGELIYRGPLMAGYILHYLDNLIDPLTPIQEEGQLLDLISRHDAVAVGSFDFKDPASLTPYDLFFKASVRALQTDPWRRVKFCVITSRKVAQKLHIGVTSSIHLYSWNSTVQVQTYFKSSDDILKWIYDEISDSSSSSLVDWFTPSGRKSDSLAEVFDSNPTLVLLTPRSLIFGISPYFDILREVAMDYHNCANSPAIKSLIYRSILRRRATEESLIEMEEKCHELTNPSNIESKPSTWKTSSLISEDTCCHSQIVRWRPIGKPTEKKCYCTACIRIALSKCPSGCKKFNCLATVARYLNSFEPLEINKTASFCNEIKSTYQPKYTPYYKIEVTCSGNIPVDLNSHPFTSLTNNDNDISSEETYDSDYFSSFKFLSDEANGLSSSANLPSRDEKIVRMMKNLEHQYCSRLALGLNYSDFNFPDSGEGSMSIDSFKWRENFTGLACEANKTLNFIAIDSILYPGFAESLGIDIFNETHATLAFIIESKHENIYLLNHQLASTCCSSSTINKRAIYDFIRNYTDNKLARYLRTSKDQQISSSEHCLHGSGDDPPSSGNVVCVPELHSSNFKEIVLSSKDILVMYYTPWCGYCSTVAHIYLKVAKYFQGIDGILFTRINGDTNDLPFEYNVDKYPTIMLFPAHSKSETVTFPGARSITESNLLGFILTYAQPSVRLQIGFSLCDTKCLLRNWFAYSKRSSSLFKSYKLDLINLAFLRDKLKDLRKKQKTLQQTLIDHQVQRIRSKRRQFDLLFQVNQFLVRRLTLIAANPSAETIKPYDKWLIEIIGDILRHPKQSSKNERRKKSKSTSQSTATAVKSNKRNNKATKDEL